MDIETGQVPENLSEFEVVERAGLRVGLIGLVEKLVVGFRYRIAVERLFVGNG